MTGHWAFIAAAYIVGVGGTVALVAVSWRAMIRAERAATPKREVRR